MTKTGLEATPERDLDPETLMETLVRFQRPLIIGAIVGAVLLGGGWMMKRSSEIRETRALDALASGEQAYASGNAALAQVEFEKVVGRYLGTAAGTQAALMSAQLYFEAGNVDSAMSRLEAALTKAPKHLRSGVLAHLAAGHALAGRPAEAASAFERAAEAARFTQEKDELRMDAARQHLAAGNVDAARAIFTEISEREDSANAAEAKMHLGELILRT